MLWICAILVFLASCYAIISALLFAGVSKSKKDAERSVIRSLGSQHDPESGEESVDLLYVSVLVPARNEERVIADCLESLVRQQYPFDKYEIVVVNDRSEDKTPIIIDSYQKKYKIIKCVSIDSNTSGLTGKQNAMNAGLKICAGEIILNTDADCIAGTLWVRRTVSHFAPGVGLTIGFSMTYPYDPNRSLHHPHTQPECNAVQHAASGKALLSNLQSLDTLFLMYIAAGAIGMNTPISCLGRNLAYRKVILDDLGYPTMRRTITEDAALIQAVDKESDWGIAVVYDKEAAVLTLAEESLRQFLSQRVRWFMGGHTGRLWLRMQLYFVLLLHLCLLGCFPLIFFSRYSMAAVLYSILMKAAWDFIGCWRVCKQFDRLSLLKLFVPYEIFQILYSILTGLSSIFLRGVRWKGTVYRKTHETRDR